MKKSTLAVAIGLSLSLPASVMASSGEEVTIRVMEMHQNAKQLMMNEIELPEQANETAREQAMKQAQERTRDRDHDSDNEFESEQDRERVREHEYEHEGEMEQHQEMEQERNELEHGDNG